MSTHRSVTEKRKTESFGGRGIDSTKTQWRGIQLLVGRVVCARSIISDKTNTW